MRATATRMGLSAILVLAAALGACSDDDPPAADDPVATTTTTTTAPVDADLLPPDTPLGDGLVVPEGARLVGTVFTETTPWRDETAGTAWTALLLVGDDDPFAVLDALATQARDAGFALPGSAAACVLHPPVEEGRSVPSPVRVVDADPGLEVEVMDCSATAGDGQREVSVHAQWSADRTGTVEVTGSASMTEEPHAQPEVVGTPLGPLAESTATVPAAQVALVPDRAPAEHPAPGDLFGGSANCLASGEDRLRLPEGARLVATEAGGDGTSVLAVDDVDAAMDALVDDASGGGGLGGLDIAPREDVAIVDGSTARLQRFEVPAGGGACNLLGSPDGRFVLIRMHSD